ncbi:MAG: DUF5119 domain-containing protein [Bacteroides sp.]|nr:DUF5119 domain-containing protein [Bacteroides sp.]
MLCVMAILLGGCRKDLCYNHYREAQFDINWEYAWERDYGKHWPSIWSVDTYGMTYEELQPSMSESVTMLDYNEEGEVSQNFFTSESGKAALTEGTHSFLFYNNDTEYIIFNNMASLPTASATTSTRTRSTFVNSHTDERTVNAPDVLYGTFMEDIPAIDIHQTLALKATLRPLVYTYLVRYEFQTGADYISLARGALSGMAESIYLRDGYTSEKTATVLYDCTLASWGVQAIVKSFGAPGFPDEYYSSRTGQREIRHYALNLEVMLKNGNMKTFDFDITEQMQNQPRGGVIVVKGLIIAEDEIGSDSGFDVTINDWGEFEDIDMPVKPM